MSSKGNDLTVVILLAAGSSSRMGQSKQLLPVNGRSLLHISAKAALDAHAEKVFVVLGSSEPQHRIELRGLPLEFVSNSDWSKGIGSSIRAGLSAALTQYPELGSAVFIVCDQPGISAKHINNLIVHRNRGRSIVASSYSDTLGVPALFGAKFFPALLRVGDAEGARRIINGHSDEVDIVPFPEGAIDLDTPEDYQKFIDG